MQRRLSFATQKGVLSLGNIYSYLKWRGDLTFSERPFCEVDNLVLSELAYMDFRGIVPTKEEAGSITVEEAAAQFQQQGRQLILFGEASTPIVECMAATNRFRHIKLSNYIDVFDEQTQTQFAALQIELGDGTAYIAFRGTDDSLVGWQEDFSMSFQLMPSQKAAAEYLRQTLSNPDMQYRIGGHSKGGNLAVYAAMQCSAEQQKQIIEIYNNDGPGICDSIVDMEQYRQISSKLIRIVPEFSVIGALFEHEEPTKIVASSASGFMQHDGSTWQIEGDHFCEKADLSDKCKFYNEIFDTWIESASMEQREAFVADFFGALEAGGAKNISELSQGGVEEFETILTAITTQSGGKTKIVIGKFFVSIFQAFRHINLKKLMKSGNAIKGTICFIVGMFFLIAPGIATRSISMGLGITAICWMGKRVLVHASSSEADLKQSKYKVIFYIAAISIVSFFLGKTSVMLRLTNLLVGVFFLIYACKQIRKSSAPQLHTRRRILYIASGGVLFVLGIVPILFRGMEFTPYAGVAGVWILLYGISLIAFSMYENGKQNT